MIRVAIDFFFYVVHVFFNAEISGLSKKNFKAWANRLSSYNRKYDIYFLLISSITEARRDHSKCSPSDPHSMQMPHKLSLQGWSGKMGKTSCRKDRATGSSWPPHRRSSAFTYFMYCSPLKDLFWIISTMEKKRFTNLFLLYKCTN